MNRGRSRCARYLVLTLLLTALAPWPQSVLAAATDSWVVHGSVDVDHMEPGPNRLTNPGFESGSGSWQRYGSGYTVDSAVAHSGAQSIRLEGSALSAAIQQVALNQQAAGPFYVSGWSKASAATAGCRMQYSLYLDIFYTDGSQGYSEWICFDGGTHGWQQVSRIIQPTKAVKSVYLWTMYAGSGKVWFDDLALGVFGGDIRTFDGGKILYGAPTAQPWQGSDVLQVATGDGLALGLSANGGAVTSVRVNGQEQVDPAGTYAGGFFVRDVPAGSDFIHLGGTVTASSGKLLYAGADTSLGLTLNAQFEGRDQYLVIDASLQDTTASDRAISLYFALPVAAQGRTWWQDIRTGYAAGAVSESTFALDTTRRWGETGWVENDGFGANGLWSHYPLSSLGGEENATGVAGLTLAYPMDRPAVARFVYNASTAQYYVAFELGLSPQARVPGRADVRFILYHHEPEWGFRAAFAKYVSIYPEFFATRVEEQGVWVAHAGLTGIPNIEDFHIQFHESGDAGCYDEDDAVGAYTLRYLTEPWGYWLRPPSSVDTSDYGAVMDYVEEMRTSAPGANERRWGEAILSSGSFDQAGRYRYEASSQAFASHTAAMILNADPELTISPYTSTKATQSWSQNRQEPYDHPEWGILDGEYIDCFETHGLYANYRSEHFRFSNLPLTFSTSNYRPTLPHIFSNYELVQWIAEDVHALNRYMMGNSMLLRYGFPAHLFDIMGSERGWVINGRFQPDTDSLLNLWRTMSYRKPYCVLQNGDLPSFNHAMVESYFAYCAFYGIYPSFFTHDGGVSNYWSTPSWYERDRDLFAKYLPMIIGLNEAGWEPVTYASTSQPALVYIERYGSGETFYLTLRNATDVSQDIRVTVDLPSLGLPATDAYLVEELLTGATLSPTWATEELRVPLTVPAKSTRILRVALLPGTLYSIPLQAGWNLVATPGRPTFTEASGLFAEIDDVLDRAYTWDTARKAWRSYQPQVPAACSLTELQAGEGLWIHLTADAEWQMRCQPLGSITLDLVPGWNLVGYPLESGQDLAAAAAPLGAKLLLINGYTGATPSDPWLSFVPGLGVANTLTRLEPGQGYWVQVSEACQWVLNAP